MIDKDLMVKMAIAGGVSNDDSGAYQSGYNDGYSIGYADGVDSVDTTIYYNNGVANGIQQASVVINPTSNESASIIFASGASGNHAFIDRYALAKVVNINGSSITISGSMILDKVMNSTNSSTSSGAWRIDLIQATSGNVFADFKTVYTDAFDTQGDLDTSTDTQFVVNRTPTNNQDMIDIDLTLSTDPNTVYYVVLTYGCTGLGYYARSVVSNFDITITLG